MLLLVAGAVLGGAMLYRRGFRAPPLTREQEPNDQPGEANLLAPNQPVTGYLGRRMDRYHSDADVYAILNPGGQRRVMALDVTGIPNMDIAVDVVRAGVETPVLVADSGGVGAAERVPNFPIAGPKYFLRVRESWGKGELATENVSDPYTIRWHWVQAGDDQEKEVNDSLELAEQLPIGATRKGYIGWSGDVDTWCLSDDGTNVVAKVGPVPGIDLVLRVVDRTDATSHSVDDHGVGEGEESPPIGHARAGSTCFEVSADDGAGARANPDTEYVLRIDGSRS